MAKKKDRDIEKEYTTKQTVVKLRRLADCLEHGKSFHCGIASPAKRTPASVQKREMDLLSDREYEIFRKSHLLNQLFLHFEEGDQFELTRQQENGNREPDVLETVNLHPLKYLFGRKQADAPSEVKSFKDQQKKERGPKTLLRHCH
jgi:hypothetical protein